MMKDILYMHGISLDEYDEIMGSVEWNEWCEIVPVPNKAEGICDVCHNKIEGVRLYSDCVHFAIHHAPFRYQLKRALNGN